MCAAACFQEFALLCEWWEPPKKSPTTFFGGASIIFATTTFFFAGVLFLLPADTQIYRFTYLLLKASLEEWEGTGGFRKMGGSKKKSRPPLYFFADTQIYRFTYLLLQASS